MALLFLIAQQASALALLVFVVCAAGTAAIGPRETLVDRATLGLAVLAHALFFLALAGWLRPVPIGVLAVTLIAGGLRRGLGLQLRMLRKPGPFGVVALAMALAAFILCLQAPLAFDETLYHLPFVESLATTGRLTFSAHLRFPVFPQFHELLCVPLFLLAGDVATHLVSLVAVGFTAWLLFEWGRRRDVSGGALAAALLLGSPIVFHLATITYVDATLTLFVTAGFSCLDRAWGQNGEWNRRWLAASGFFFGTACSVKYLGGFFAVGGMLIVFTHAWPRIRSAVIYVMACLAAALPTTLWLVAATGNPVFPYLPSLFGSSAWAMSFAEVGTDARSLRALRLAWDVTFDRAYVNAQPPFTPFFILLLLIVMAAALRNAKVRWLVLLGAGYVAILLQLPPDSRYLVPLLPLASVAAAVTLARRWPRAVGWLVLLAMLPGVLYGAYRLWLAGAPPATPVARMRVLLARTPEIAALPHARGLPVYGCGVERLQYYGRGRLIGDFNGLHPFALVFGDGYDTAAVADHLRRIGVSFYLVSKRACGPAVRSGGMELVFEDDAAELWRVLPARQSSPRSR